MMINNSEKQKRINNSSVDILIKQALLRNKNLDRFDILIDNGKIVEISKNIQAKAKIILDANGGLVCESFVNPHLHLCKVYTLQMMEEDSLRDYHGKDMGSSMSAIEQASSIKESYSEEWILKNAIRALSKAIYYGCTHIRAFADVDGKARLEGIKALIKAKEEFSNIVDVQIVAFPQDGIIREKGSKELMREAMSMGADVVGGIPWIEYTDNDIESHVRFCFDLAQEFDKSISMLVDDAGDPGLRSLEVMTIETIRRGWNERSLAHHARAMSLYPTPYLKKLIALIKSGGVGLVTNPHTGPLHARVTELIEGGVLVCLGQDDISDAYYPFGRNNMLEVAFLASHLLWYTTEDRIEMLFDMITKNAGNAIGLKGHKLEVGCDANIVILKNPNIVEALRFHEAPKYVISNGKLIDKDKYKAKFQTIE